MTEQKPSSRQERLKKSRARRSGETYEPTPDGSSRLASRDTSTPAPERIADALERFASALEEGLGAIKVGFEATNERMDTLLEGKLAEFQGAIDSKDLQALVVNLSTRVDALESMVTAAEQRRQDAAKNPQKKYVEQSVIDALAERLDELEKHKKKP